MGRSNLLLSAVMMSAAIVFGAVSTAQAQYVMRQDNKQVSQKPAHKLTLPQKADILNKMAIHNARSGNISVAARYFLKSFHASRIARDKKRAMRAISNLKRLERKFGKAAILQHGKARAKITPVKPHNYKMPDWRVSHEA